MPETATRPARTRAARTSAPKTAKPVTAKPATENVEETEDTRERIPFKLEHMGDTKSYAKFGCPDSMKGVCVGTIYAPLGTQEVKVLLLGTSA